MLSVRADIRARIKGKLGSITRDGKVRFDSPAEVEVKYRGSKPSKFKSPAPPTDPDDVIEAKACLTSIDVKGLDLQGVPNWLDSGFIRKCLNGTAPRLDRLPRHRQGRLPGRHRPGEDLPAERRLVLTMNRRATTSTLLALLLWSAAALADGARLRYTITVTSFENLAGVNGSALGNAWGLVMTDVLQRSGRFTVLGEGDQRANALAEQDFANSGRTVQGAKTPVTGAMTPAQLLLEGAVTHVELDSSRTGGGLHVGRLRLGGRKARTEINLTLYLVDASTGMTVASTSVVGSAARRGLTGGLDGYTRGGEIGRDKNDNLGLAVEAAALEAVEWLIGAIERVPWRGSVALVRDGRVYINRGERDGVGEGRIFRVGTSEVLRDPDTGEVLDELLDEIGMLRVVEAKAKLSICDVTVGDWQQIERGMAVTLP